MSNDELTQLALSLPLRDRVDLAQALWQSLGPEQAPDAAEEREVLETAKARDRELATGATQGETHEQVMEAARRALRCS